MKFSTIITCEHAGNEIPREFEFLFKGHHDIINSHRGWDPGAYSTAEYLAENLNCPLYSCHTTRLLIETNRSLDSPQLFSEFSNKLSNETKENLIQDLYEPYRMQIEKDIHELTKPVLHLSMHSFTPVWNGKEREVDIGLLFDPRRDLEVDFSKLYQQKLSILLPGYKIKFNEPYLGTDDGFTTHLRTKFSNKEYAGIEIEVNQKFANQANFPLLQSALFHALPF